MNIAFIGLGNMGGGMAANLAKAGHKVRAFDLSDKALETARDKGCTPCTDAAETVRGAAAVVTMLPNGAIVKDVYTKDIIGNAPSEAVLIDCSTIDVATAREVIAAAEAHSHAMVDSPVSGGIAAAEAGTLTFMVGGSDAAFERAKPVLEAMGKAVIHAGAAGNGQAAKICNNMLLGIHMVGTCEAFRLAEKLGLDPQTFFDIASVSSGQCWSLTSYCPMPGIGPKTPADNDYQGGFATALMLKDLRLATEAAQSVEARVPLGQHAQGLFEMHDAAGNGTSDFSSIIKSL